ncbi:hypothetical protein SISSUDRAFT_53036 [Sistotremastrum suecicum HHB10207 ss-3]|uniref:Uncharacterized protein n=1 Tax=Sistotremastrum suecicum HHB10207 ss-3 TaxID=1314776 RepID=A0A166HBX0_9AGAM|nr:hypothetical protein SISSUDRAFT_53036 [Sistotremastrum suecicum HHB10207 ss-3]
MRLAVVRLRIPANPLENARFIEYPSHPVSFPVTGCFVQGDIVGLIGIISSTGTVGMLLLDRQSAVVVRVDTGVPTFSEGPGSYLDAVASPSEVILYREDPFGSHSYHYTTSSLIRLFSSPHLSEDARKETRQSFLPNVAFFPPQESKAFVFSDDSTICALHSCEIMEPWTEGGPISCLSTCYETDTNQRDQFTSINHHFFDPSCPSGAIIHRTFHSYLRTQEHIRVNERGVELIVLGSHGRHGAWLIDGDDGPLLQVATFPLEEKGHFTASNQAHIKTVEIEEGDLSQVDSIELEDAMGTLILTTPTHILVYQLN